MARVVDYYKATLNARWYIYPDAYTMQNGTQYEPGTGLALPANYGERLTNSRYPVISPENGWLNWTYISDIMAVYKTVTDRCTDPEALIMDSVSKLMTIVGGEGGDLNTLTGFGISWRERGVSESTWESWSVEEISAGRSVSVTVNPGKVRQYRARTRGSAGSDYYSNWVVCETLLNGNTAASMPTVLLPGNEAVTASRTPVVVVSCGADPEGDQMTLQRSIDGESWVSAATVDGSGTTVFDRLPVNEAGRHTIRYRLVDSGGAESDTASLVIVIQRVDWSRSIASGDIISNDGISHVADIEEMLYAVNVQRMYYGLERIELPGTVGRFADWRAQMQTMLDAVNKSLLAAGQQVESGRIESAWPYADAINLIRERAMMV